MKFEQEALKIFSKKVDQDDADWFDEECGRLQVKPSRMFRLLILAYKQAQAGDANGD